MSKRTFALSLLVIACGVTFMGRHLPTGAQTVTHPVSPQKPKRGTDRGLIKGGEARHGSPGVSLGGAEPLLRPLEMFPKVEDFTFEDVDQRLDGLDCTNCTFKDVTLDYEGGNFNLVNASFSGRIRLVLKGTAANTASAVSMLAAIGSGNRATLPGPNQPVIKATIAKQPVKLDWKNPYSGHP